MRWRLSLIPISHAAPARRIGAGAATLLLAGCAGSAAPTAGAVVTGALHPSSTIAVALSDSGCAPEPAVALPGVVTFRVANRTGRAVSELDVDRPDGLTIGQQVNLTPGVSSTITVRLAAGRYTIFCPGATVSRNAFTVQPGADWHANPLLVGAQQRYVAYLRSQGSLLVTATDRFANAVVSGDGAGARAGYLKARLIDERIRGFFEGPGALDKRINGVLNEFPTATAFVGFHRLEKALWQGPAAGAAPVAGSLLGDVQQAVGSFAGAQPAPADIANGAASLLVRVITIVLSGELEQYSGLSLAMAQADLDGSVQAYQAVRPALAVSAPQLTSTVDAQIVSASAALARFRASPGQDGSGFVSYALVGNAQRHQLVLAFNTLAASMSQVGARVQ